MSYKQLLRAIPLLGSITIFAAICVLYLQGSLTLYIHPRYELFSIVMCSIGLIAVLYAYYAGYAHTHESSGRAAILYGAVVAVIILFAPTTLSTQLASSRLIGSGPASTEQLSSFDTFSNDYQHFSIQDWSQLLATTTTPDDLIDKEAQVTGFYLTDNGQDYIARFRLSCCAVDATPYTMPLAASTVPGNLIESEWYVMTGVIVQTEAGLALKIESATAIEEPDEPYLY